MAKIDSQTVLDVMDEAGYEHPFNLLEDMVFVKREN